MRVALLSSEPIRSRMAGIGIRYLELARRLPGEGIGVVLISPAEPEETKALEGLEGVEVRRRLPRKVFVGVAGVVDQITIQALEVRLAPIAAAAEHALSVFDNITAAPRDVFEVRQKLRKARQRPESSGTFRRIQIDAERAEEVEMPVEMPDKGHGRRAHDVARLEVL